MHFEWLTFDECYGSKPPFLRTLDQRQQKFIGEVHKGFVAWIDPPEVVDRRDRPTGPGQPRKTPRLKDRSPKGQPLEQLAKSHSSLRNQRWQMWRMKDGQKGPIVWKVRQAPVFLKAENGLPIGPIPCWFVATP